VGLPIISYTRAVLTTSVSTSNGAFTIVKLDTIQNTSPAITYNTGTGLWTCNIAGTFLFNTTVAYAGNATGARVAYYKLNGTTIYMASLISSNATASPPCASTSVSLNLNVGDTIGVFSWQNSGGNLNINGTGSALDFYTQTHVTCTQTPNIITGPVNNNPLITLNNMFWYPKVTPSNMVRIKMSIGADQAGAIMSQIFFTRLA